MDNHFLQGNCLPQELSSLPRGGDGSPNQGGESSGGGGKLALSPSRKKGVLNFRPSRQLIQLQTAPPTSARVHSRKMGSGEDWLLTRVCLAFLLWVSCLSGKPCGSLHCSHRNKEVSSPSVLLPRSKMSGESFVLSEAWFGPWYKRVK